MDISQTYKRDSFAWMYTKSGQYTVKSGYWVARNILKGGADVEVLEPSIKKLQELVWKVKAPKKMCHLMWQCLTGHMAVTRNLNQRNMRCDNVCPRCAAPDETVSHAIFECPPALQVWALSPIPSSPHIFPGRGVFADMDYLLRRKEGDQENVQERDPYPWIIWYLWKARNDKLFNGIDRDPLKLLRYAVGECEAWYEANMEPASNDLAIGGGNQQALCLNEICLVDGSWTETDRFSGYGWTLMDRNGGHELMGMKNVHRRESPLHTELEALRWAMESVIQASNCQKFGTDCKDILRMIDNPEDWPAFSTELEKIKMLKFCLPEFSIIHVPRGKNGAADSLAKTARSFFRPLCFVGCSIPAWIPGPPHV